MEKFSQYTDLMKEHPTRTAALAFGLVGGLASSYCFHRQVNPLLKLMIGYIFIESGRVIGTFGDEMIKESTNFQHYTFLSEQWREIQAKKYAFRNQCLTITGRVLYHASSFFVGFGVGYTLGTTFSLLMMMKEGV